MRSITIIVTILCSFSLMAFYQTTPADRIIGEWNNDKKDKTLRFYKAADGSYEAKAKTGQVCIKALIYKDGKYSGGELYLPAKDTWVKCSAILKDDHTLNITGSKGMFSKTVTWTK